MYKMIHTSINHKFILRQNRTALLTHHDAKTTGTDITQCIWTVQATQYHKQETTAMLYYLGMGGVCTVQYVVRETLDHTHPPNAQCSLSCRISRVNPTSQRQQTDVSGKKHCEYF